MVFKSTCLALCCRDAGCVSSVRTYLPGTVLQGCRLFELCWNLPARHCVAGVQGSCLSGVGTYLPCTVLQVCRLFRQCPNLPAGNGVAAVQAAEAVLEPTCRALCCKGTDCLSGVRNYLQCTVLQGCRLLKGCWTYLLGTVLQGSRLFKWCLSLPTRHCVAGMQAF